MINAQLKKFKIVPKRDFGEGKGFFVEGKYVKKGFVVTDGVCNIMPGATWFFTIREALHAIGIYNAVDGDPVRFWGTYQN